MLPGLVAESAAGCVAEAVLASVIQGHTSMKHGKAGLPPVQCGEQLVNVPYAAISAGSKIQST